MGKKQKKIFVGFIIGYGIVSFICLFLVATKCAKNSNWMSYLGSGEIRQVRKSQGIYDIKIP